jgi:hypothetical protein
MVDTMSRIASIIIACVAALMIAACDGGLAGPQEAATVEGMLSGQVDYWSGIAELQGNPESALRALRERTESPGTRRAFVERMLDDHLSNAGQYARWQARVDDAGQGRQTILGPVYSPDVRELDSDRHSYFWAERLLYPLNDALAEVAVDQLIAINSQAAADALLFAASDVRQEPELLEKATRGLAQRGAAISLTEILASRGAASETDPMKGLILAALADLPKDVHRSAERILLDRLNKESSPHFQTAALEVLGEIGSEQSRQALIDMRKRKLDPRVEDALDRALSRILQRQGLIRLPASTLAQSTDATDPDLQKAYEQEWQKEYEGLR